MDDKFKMLNSKSIWSLNINPLQKFGGFGAYLQGEYILHDFLVGSRLVPGREITKKDLEEIFSRMSDFKGSFDVVYSEPSLQLPTHPLAEERKMWDRLSPDMENFLSGFEKYKNEYSPQNLSEEKRVQLDSYLDIWWMFIQEWNVLSNSVKTKMNSFLKT